MTGNTKQGIFITVLRQSAGTISIQAKNQLCAFLRGIEGLDNTRAGKCLARLLEAHYDTISVLKLATKQDLIEDAGILPGDALRIVCAAKEAVIANRDVDHHRDLGQHASKPGGAISVITPPAVGRESRQHAYVPPAPREKTVICNPPVRSESPRSTIVPLVRPENKREKTIAQETSPRQKVINDLDEPAQTIPARPDRPFHACGVCNVWCGSEHDICSHYNGRRHAHILRLATEDGDSSPTGHLSCSICQVSCTSKKNLVMHFNGKKHSSNVEVDSHSESDSDSDSYGGEAACEDMTSSFLIIIAALLSMISSLFSACVQDFQVTPRLTR